MMIRIVPNDFAFDYLYKFISIDDWERKLSNISCSFTTESISCMMLRCSRRNSGRFFPLFFPSPICLEFRQNEARKEHKVRNRMEQNEQNHLIEEAEKERRRTL